MTSFAWGTATDTGRTRPANEDYLLVTTDLFVVADGMGGHNAGEVASHVASEAVRDLLAELDATRTTDDLVDAVQRANERLVTMAGEDPELTGMGTTLCALALVESDGRDVLGIVNVGDSRLYLLKEGELEQITDDHSLVATLERQGKLTRSEAAVHPQRNILTRALGIDERVMVDSWEILPFVGDRYLLCSDGLFNEVDDARIAATLRRLADPGEAASELVRLANEGGGRDNITCLVVDVADDEGRDPAVVGAAPRITHKVDGKDRVLAAAHQVADPHLAEIIASGGAPIAVDRRSKLTWRVALFVVILMAIAGLAVGTIIYSGTRTYFVGVSDGQVVVFRGQPGGVLWIEPEVVEDETSTLSIEDVPVALVPEIEQGKEQSSLEAARRYIANIEQQRVGTANPDTAVPPSTSTSTASPGTTEPPAA